MARITRSEVFAWDEIAIVHTMSQVVRQSYLLGTDLTTGKCYDHRRERIELELKRLAAGLGIDLLCYSLMSTHFHLVLRSRPDVVAQWNDTEVARRWLIAVPIRKGAKEPTEAELNSIRNDPAKVQQIRQRLSSISTWMKLLCQRISIQANREDKTRGAFFASRYKGVRLLDEESVLACAAYVDLNPIRAAMAQTLEESVFTSVKTRIGSLLQSAQQASDPAIHAEQPTSAEFLAPVGIDEQSDVLGPRANLTGGRASDKGFLPISETAYVELLDWTARQIIPGKRASTPPDAPPIFKRLSITPTQWYQLVCRFGKLFNNVAGSPRTVESARSRIEHRRFRLAREASELLCTDD